MVSISAHAGTISTICKCPTYAELAQFCSKNCLESPWDSQIPT